MTLPDEVAYLDYRVRWRDGAARPGRHAMRQSGRDGEFRGYRPFWQCPDARQIDVRRSALEPSGDIMVRQTGQRSSINLVLAVDVSRSMQPAPERSALGWVVALAEAASRSALRAGDAFGMLGFDRGLREDVWLPPTRSRAAIGEVLSRLRGLRHGGRGADGMAELAERLPSRRCLVLLISDFLVPLSLVERALSALARHDVAPVVLAMDTPREAPRAGLLRLEDAETGRTRLMLMRPGLQRRWQEAEAARRRAQDLLFLRFGRPAFYAAGGLDIRLLSQHLAGV